MRSLALIAIAGCAIDSRPIPNITITLTLFCSSIGCGLDNPPECLPDYDPGFCLCNVSSDPVCYVPSCDELAPSERGQLCLENHIQ